MSVISLRHRRKPACPLTWEISARLLRQRPRRWLLEHYNTRRIYFPEWRKTEAGTGHEKMGEKSEFINGNLNRHQALLSFEKHQNLSSRTRLLDLRLWKLKEMHTKIYKREREFIDITPYSLLAARRSRQLECSRRRCRRQQR